MLSQRFIHSLFALALILSFGIPASTAQPRALKSGETIEVELRPGQSQSYALALTPLDFARLAVNTNNQDLTIKILTPEGKAMVVREVSRDANAASVSFVAGYVGEFRLEITSREKEEAGEKVEIKFAEQRTVAPGDADRIAAEEAFAEGEQFRAREVNEERRPAIAKYEEALGRWRKLKDRAGEGRALHTLARVYDNLSQGEKAIEHFNQAIEIRREIKDRAGEAASLSGLANILNNLRGERPRAMELYQQALRIRREMNDRRGEAADLQNIGNVHRGMNQRDKAIDLYQQALRIRREINDVRGEESTLFQIAVVSREMGNFDHAWDSYQKLLAAYRTRGNKRSEATTLSSMGVALLSQGKPQQSLEYLLPADELQRTLGMQRERATTLNNTGGAYSNLGDQTRALDYHNRALEISRAINNPSAAGIALLGIGGIYNERGESSRALEHYNEARPLLRATGGPAREAYALLQIGALRSEAGYRQEALDSYLQALALWREARLPAEQASVLATIGSLYRAIGERGLAIDYYQQALDLRRSQNNPIEQARMLTALGAVSQEMDESRKALDYVEQALKLGQGDRGITASALNRSALIQTDLDGRQTALDQLNQALPLAREIGARRLEADTLHNIGWVHRAMKNLGSARDHLNQSLEIYRAIGSRSNEAFTLFALANVENDAGELGAARTRIEAAIEIAESLRAGLGSTELRASYFASVQKYYDLYVEVLMKLHDRDRQAGLDAEALQVTERARARSLLDLLNESGTDIRQGADPSMIERERDLQQLISAKAAREMQLRLAKAPAPRIDEITAEIKLLTADYQNIQARIRSSSPRYAALTQPQPLSVKQVQEQVVDRDTLLLEYALGDRQSFLWAVTPATLRSYKLPRRETIEDAARLVYELLTERNREEPGESAPQQRRRVAQADAELNAAMSKLSRMLLGPVAAQLGNKRLLIVAQGALQYIPFGALPEPGTRRQGDISPLHPVPLVARHEVVSLPSASTIVALRREIAGRQPAEKMLAVFADPVFEKDDERVTKIAVKTEAAKPQTTAATRLLKHASDQFAGRIPRLPFTRREADSILALVPEADARPALGFTANRASVSAADLSRYRYIHFATHGILNSQNPELSSIVLSLVDEGGTPQDGFLRAMEVYNLNLPAEAVVLSACETGLGKQIKGEGLVGLTRGFMYAGTPRVIVSLWAVNDQATAELMTRLYRKMLKENLRPAAALRAAQIELFRETQWKSPYYWAAFAAQGEWR